MLSQTKISENHNMSEQQHRPFIKLKNESGSEIVHYSAVYEGFPDEFKLTAEKELDETDENRRKGLQKLREYIKREHMTVLDDSVLLAVLRSSKYNLKKSQSKLENFLVKRREIIDMLSVIDKDKIETIIDHFPVGILPYRDRHGRAIIYTRPYGIDLEKFEMDDVGVLFAVTVLFLIKFPISSVVGFSYYGECRAPNLYIFYPILKTLKKIMFYLFTFPLRISRVEVLNENSLCRCFLKVVSPVLSKKLLSRISLHGEGYDNLHKLYDPNILPEEFGGNLGPLTNAFYKQKLLEFIQELRNETI